jgi:hypothetical protein
MDVKNKYYHDTFNKDYDFIVYLSIDAKGAAKVNLSNAGWSAGDQDLPVVVSRDAFMAQLLLEIASGELTEKDAANIIKLMTRYTDEAAKRIGKQIADLVKQRDKLLHMAATPPSNPVKNGFPVVTTRSNPVENRTPAKVAVGYWRLKDGFPKIACKDGSHAGYQEVWDVTSASMTVQSRWYNTTTQEATEAFNFEGTYSGLGKATYNPGEEILLALNGDWTWVKDAGHYDKANLEFDAQGAATIVKSEPQLPGRSAESSAFVRVGRMADTVKTIPEDHRDITIQIRNAPGSPGEEFSYFVLLGPWCTQVTWTYEWVAR